MTKKIKDKQWEKEHNMRWSCSKHGKETYFNIKKQEKERGMKSFVYVWFRCNKLIQRNRFGIRAAPSPSGRKIRSSLALGAIL